jgi:uncharacterized membrane protein
MIAFRRHLRFLVAFVLGLTVLVLTTVAGVDPVLRVLIAANCTFAVYLGLMLRLTVTTTPDDLRRHAEADDEGSALIILLAVVAVAVSVTAVFLVLNREIDTLAEALLALATVPLGWALIHMLVAYTYAHLYYGGDGTQCLEFPGRHGKAPEVSDFIYLAFTIGMTAQTSDVQILGAPMRRSVLVHAVGSFFYNTVILALAVNAGLALSR